MNERMDCLIVGAGAAGIGMGVVLKEIGMKNYAILERNEIGSSFRAWPEEMRLITPSFTGNAYGMMDLNAVAINTSPAFTLGTEHPSGQDYANYLEAVSEFHKLPVRTGVDVLEVQSEEGGYRVKTSSGILHTRFLVWAAGEYQYPRMNSIPGSEHGIHNSQVLSWSEMEGDNFVIIGGYESGTDAAIHLSRLGKKVIVLDRRKSILAKGSSDPSMELSPYTKDRLREEMKKDRIRWVGGCNITQIERNDQVGYTIHCEDEKGETHTVKTEQPPILATGFDGSLRMIEHLFIRNENGHVVLGEADESVVSPGLYVSGPSVMHDQLLFCFIYKFRQRFAVIASHMGTALGLDLSPLDAYRREGMFLDDLSCCQENCTC